MIIGGEKEWEEFVSTSVDSLRDVLGEAYERGFQRGRQVGHETFQKELDRHPLSSDIATLKAKLARVEATIDDAHLDGYETRQAIRAALEDKP